MELKMIKISEIHANPLQPRQEFDQDKLQELANSIKEGELLQPIVVRPLNSSYEIVAGERRFRAFQILKEPEIPAIVRDIKDDVDALEKSLIENWQRDDLKDTERRKAINDLWKSGKYNSIRELSRKTGISLGSIQEYIDEEKYRSRVNTPDSVSHTTVRATKGLTDEVRKKAIEISQEKQIPARKLEEEIIPKIKEFPEPEQQLEILDEFEKQEEWSKDAFDTIIEEKKRIVKKERPPEWNPPQEEHRWFLDDMKRHFDKIYTYGIGNLGDLPKKQRDEAIEILANSFIYLMGQLVELEGIEAVRKLYEEKIKA